MDPNDRERSLADFPGWVDVPLNVDWNDAGAASDLEPGILYKFRFKNRNALGFSAWSPASDAIATANRSGYPGNSQCWAGRAGRHHVHADKDCFEQPITNGEAIIQWEIAVRTAIDRC